MGWMDIGSSLITGGAGIGGTLIGGKQAGKEGGDQRKHEAEQQALDRIMRDKEIELKEKELFLQKSQAEQRLMFDRDQFGLQKEQFDENTAMGRARKQAFEEARTTGTEQFGAGESAFLDEANKSPEELQQLKQDIMEGNTESMQMAGGQLQAGLAQQGVRGGAGATQLRRGIGQMGRESQRDVNELIGNDAMKRAAERRAYQAAKAGTGQAASLRTAAY